MEESKKLTMTQKKEKLEPSMDNLENSIKLWWNNFSIFFRVYLEALLYPVIAFIAVAILMVLENYAPNPEPIRVLFVFAFIIAIVFSIYFLTRAYLGIALLVDRDYKGASKEIFAETKSLFWPYFALAILSTILIVLWSLLLIIPGIIYSVFYSFAIFVFLFENKRGKKALNRSRELVKGYFWPVFGRTLLVGIFISIIMGILSAPAGFFEEGTPMFVAWNTLIQIIAFLVAPISTIFTYRMYKDLLKIKDAK